MIPSASFKYRPDIDGLRAIAILSVLFFHAFPGICRGGFVGVDIFFVISGYLITGILVNEVRISSGIKMGAFYVRRIRRIFPALLVVLIAAFVWGRLALLPHEFIELAKQTAAGAGFLSNFLLWHEAGYFDQSSELKPLMHLWSLGVEEQFYLVWPLVLCWVARQQRAHAQKIIIGLIIALLIGSVMHVNADPVGAFFSPLSRFWEFLAGALLVFQSDRLRPIEVERPGNILAWTGFALILFSVFYINSTKAFPGLWAVLPVVGTAFLIKAGPRAWLNVRLLADKRIVWIGLISYPLYLWHWVILSFLRIQINGPRWPLRLSGLVLSAVLAALTYYLIEKRIRPNKKTFVIPVLLGSMAGVLILSLGAAEFKWFVGKSSALEQKLIAPYSVAEVYRYKTCFLDSQSQRADDFAAVCMPAAENDVRTIMLWGDSLAAQLYPGLKNLSEKNRFLIAQRTASSCPPEMPLDISTNGHCNSINSATRAYIKASPPDTVIMNGRWLDMSRPPETTIPELVEFLRSSGVHHIVLVGPTPYWYPSLREILLRGRYLTTLPSRLNPPVGTWGQTRALDGRLRHIAEEESVRYISPVVELCSNGQCLIRVSDDVPEGLITSDYDHLTREASEFLFKIPAVANQILK